MVKCFLNTISMMHVNVNIQYSWVHFQKLNNTNDYIIYITESTSFWLFSMMISTRPIYSIICLSCNNQICSIKASTNCKLAKIIQPLKARTIETLIYFIHLVIFLIFGLSCAWCVYFEIFYYWSRVWRYPVL